MSLENKKYAIVDLDNCISDDGWRIDMIDWNAKGADRFESYHNLCIHDGAKNIKQMVAAVGDAEIVIFTARPEKYREATSSWLARYGISYLALIMRKPGQEGMPSVALKEAMLRENFYGAGTPRIEDISVAIDDREDILEMYRSYGIRTFHMFISEAASRLNCEADAKPVSNSEELGKVDEEELGKVDEEELAKPSSAPETIQEIAKRFGDIETETVSKIINETSPNCSLRSPIAEILDKGAQTAQQRFEAYGNNFEQFGEVFLALFPAGVLINNVDDANRFGVLTQIISKLTRYAANVNRGGHQDSAHDICVYGAILEKLTNETPIERAL